MGQFEHERLANGWPEKCPITGRPFFMGIEDSSGDLRGTYGGPFDSYTIPEKDVEGDGGWYNEHYDHDSGTWEDGEYYTDEEIEQIKTSTTPSSLPYLNNTHMNKEMVITVIQKRIDYFNSLPHRTFHSKELKDAIGIIKANIPPDYFLYPSNDKGIMKELIEWLDNTTTSKITQHSVKEKATQLLNRDERN